MEIPTGAGAPGLSERAERVVHLSAYVERSELELLVLQAEASGSSVGEVLRRSIRIGAQVVACEAAGGRTVLEGGGARSLVDTAVPEALPGRALR